MEESEAYRGLERFRSVDATGDPEMLRAFLDRVDRIHDVAARRERSYELLGVAAGDRVVYVGCGG